MGLLKKLCILRRGDVHVPSLSDIIWSTLTVCSSSGSGEVTKSAGAEPGYDSLAQSNQRSYGAVYVTFIIGDNSGALMGLTDQNPAGVGNYAQINFAFGVPADGSHTVRVWELGVDKGNAQANNGTSDVFKINVAADGTVTYLKNGVVYYTSATSASGKVLYPVVDSYYRTQTVHASQIYT